MTTTTMKPAHEPAATGPLTTTHSEHTNHRATTSHPTTSHSGGTVPPPGQADGPPAGGAEKGDAEKRGGRRRPVAPTRDGKPGELRRIVALFSEHRIRLAFVA